jgi:hypothetical protein
MAQLLSVLQFRMTMGRQSRASEKATLGETSKRTSPFNEFPRNPFAISAGLQSIKNSLQKLVWQLQTSGREKLSSCINPNEVEQQNFVLARVCSCNSVEFNQSYRAARISHAFGS